MLSTFSFCYRFIVKKNAPGLTATKIENKIGLRIVQNGDILLKKAFIPDEDRLPGVNSFQDTNKVWCQSFSFFFFVFSLNSAVCSWCLSFRI